MLLREYLRGVLGLSHGTLTALKKDPLGILLNGEHATVRAVLHAGDRLTLALEDEESASLLMPVDLPIEVLYEDGACVVCSKPPFMPTHPSHGHYTDTLANALAFRYAEQGVPFVFRAANRLRDERSRSRRAEQSGGSGIRTCNAERRNRQGLSCSSARGRSVGARRDRRADSKAAREYNPARRFSGRRSCADALSANMQLRYRRGARRCLPSR